MSHANIPGFLPSHGVQYHAKHVRAPEAVTACLPMCHRQLPGSLSMAVCLTLDVQSVSNTNKHISQCDHHAMQLPLLLLCLHDMPPLGHFSSLFTLVGQCLVYQFTFLSLGLIRGVNRQKLGKQHTLSTKCIRSCMAIKYSHDVIHVLLTPASLVRQDSCHTHLVFVGTCDNNYCYSCLKTKYCFNCIVSSSVSNQCSVNST